MKKTVLTLPALLFILSGCFSTSTLLETENICSLLDEKISWYQSLKKSEAIWNVDKSLQLAFIYQESRFVSDAKPPRERILGVPLYRLSSAYGYAQVKSETWNWYKLKTENNNAKRDNFADVTDFIGWYATQSKKLSNIAKNDIYNQYLAYHEGHGGFNRKTYLDKSWLMKVAKKVVNKANFYKKQLASCSKRLDKNTAWTLF